MKTKFQRLNHQEKKDAIKAFRNLNDKNNYIYIKLRNSSICGFLLFLYGLGFTLYGIIDYAAWWEYTCFAFCMILGIGFCLFVNKIISGKVNDFLIKKK